MTQPNSQYQLEQQQIFGDVRIEGNENIFNAVEGDNNTLRFFSYKITPSGGVVNILPPEQQPQITEKKPSELSLPRNFANLLGREREVEQAIAALENSDLVEFYGSAGVGKSVLTRHLAHLLVAKSSNLFPDGRVYLHLHQEQSLEDLQQQLFDAFYHSLPSYKPSIERLKNYFKEKRALIILDNLNLPQKDVEKLMVEIARNCSFLLTSKKRILWGEGQSIQVEGISQDGALALIERELGRAFTAQEQAAAKAICTSLNGHPLEILQQLAGVRENKKWLADVAGRVQKTTSQKARVEQLLEPLSQQQRSVLAALAALGGIALTANQVSAVSNVRDAKSELANLGGMHLVQQEDSRYRLSPNLLDSVRQIENLTPYRLSPNLLDSVRQIENLTPYMKRAVSSFTKWAQHVTPEELRQESEAVSHLLQCSVEQGRWHNVLTLGKLFESALAVTGQWELQARVLQWYQQAAESLGNKTAIAWAAHEMGVRSLCLEETSRARNLLNKAFKLREELGDLRGAELTQHHLNLKIPTVPPISKPPVPPPQPLPWVKMLKRAAIPALVIGGLVGSITAFFPVINRSRELPPPIPSSAQNSPPTPNTGLTPKSTPTPYKDPQIQLCVAADVESELNVRPQPNSNEQPIGLLAPKEQAQPTQMRQGEFIEIGTPIKGWINGNYTQPCSSKTFTRAPEPFQDPSIPSCVTAVVKDELNVRPAPYINVEFIGKISPGEQASPTGMRQGRFIEISTPTKGWINGEYVKRCSEVPTPNLSGTSSTPSDSKTPTTSSTTPTIVPEPISPSSSSQNQQLQVKIYEGQWSSDAIQGVQATVNKIVRLLDPYDSGRDLLRIYMTINNQSSESLEFSCFFNHFYVQDDLKRIYNYKSCAGSLDDVVIPNSNSVTGFISGISVDPDTSSISVNFNVGGRSLSIRDITIDRAKGLSRRITGINSVS